MGHLQRVRPANTGGRHMTARIAIISNPTSRINRQRPNLAKELAEMAGERAVLFETPDLDAVEETARICLERGIEVLALNGGDGTNHHTLSRFVKIYQDAPLPLIYLLRGGTMNSVADSLGVTRGRPKKLMDALVKWCDGGLQLPIVERNLMVIGENYGFLFCNGLSARFLRLYYEGGNASPIKAALMIVRIVASTLMRGAFARRIWGTPGYRVRIDGVEYDGPSWTATFLGTVREIGFGFMPWPEVSEREGELGLIAMPKSSGKLLWRLPSIRLGRFRGNAEIPIYYGKEIEIEGPDDGYYLDGDFHPASRMVTIKAGPRIKILVG